MPSTRGPPSPLLPSSGRGRKSGETCLHAAAYAGSLELVKDLVRRGADPNARDNNGNIPLDLARRQSTPDVVAFLASISSSPTNGLATEQPQRGDALANGCDNGGYLDLQRRTGVRWTEDLK